MPVINGVYLKDFTALPSSVTDANIIPIAITGDNVAYRTTVSGIVTDARVTSKLLTGLSVTGGAISATDTILQAFGKVQNQINGKQTALNGTGIVEMAGTTPSYLSSTGTGNVVKATSPTLVTPALGTPASGVMTNVTGTAAGLTAGLIVDQANSATIDAAATNVINSIALRDADGDIYARTFNMANNYGDFVPNKLVGTSSSGQIREMSQAIAKTYLDLSGTNTGDQTTITGNAGTATALETTRTIWGQNFNGSANVSGALTGVTGITTSGGYTQSGATANTFTGASTFTKNVTVKSGNGDQLIIDNAGERFTQMDYYNNGGPKAVTYWDNTNNFFQIITTPASSTIRAVAGTNGVELANGGTSWTALSDIREKKIIRPIEDALTTMKDFRTVIGRYKTDSINVERAFLIAQDVQKTYPYAVTVAQDENKTLRLAYTELIPLMIKAIQELEAKIKILENK